MDAFLTIGQVAKELGVPRSRLTYWIERGDLPAPTLSVPGRKLFSRQDVEQLKGLLRIGNDIQSGRVGLLSARAPERTKKGSKDGNEK